MAGGEKLRETDTGRKRAALRNSAPGAHLAIIGLAALLVLAIAAVALAEKPTTVKAGNLVLTINGGVKPKALSKKTPQPITLNVQGKIATADGTHPPALKQIVVDTDKAGTIDARGVPVCKTGQLEATTTDTARSDLQEGDRRHRHHRRRGAVPRTGADPDPLPADRLQRPRRRQGQGDDPRPRLPEQPDLGGGRDHGQGHAKEHKGPYGTRSIATVPKIANYAGSVTAFNLTFSKQLFAYKGKKHGYLLAKCDDGSFVAQAEAIFVNGEKLGGKIVRACTPKG